MRLRRLSPAGLILWGVLAATATATATIAAQDGEPVADRSDEVGGWQILDIPEGSSDDPMARTIRMRRDLGDREIEYEVRLSGYGGHGWASTAYSSAMSRENRACNMSGSAAVETGAPAGRPARLRALLERELRELEGNCDAPAGFTAPLLEGLEGAFARLAAWHGERLAELEAAATEGQIAGFDANNDVSAYDMDMVDMNSAETMDMDMNAAFDEGAYTDMNSTPEDMNATYADEAAERALRAAEAALHDAGEAMDPPQRR